MTIISDKDAVEKRLYILQKQGYIYSTDSEEWNRKMMQIIDKLTR